MRRAEEVAVLVDVVQDIVPAAVSDNFRDAIAGDLLGLAVLEKDAAVEVGDVDADVEIVENAQGVVQIEGETLRHRAASLRTFRPRQ